jgi:hypothetical protein
MEILQRSRKVKELSLAAKNAKCANIKTITMLFFALFASLAAKNHFSLRLRTSAVKTQTSTAKAIKVFDKLRSRNHLGTQALHVF